MTKFKVGDKVVGVGHHNGETGTVFQPDHRSSYVYVRLDTEGAGYTGVFRPEELKLVETGFKTGDIVAVKPGEFMYPNLKGKRLIVHGLSDNEGYEYQVRALGQDYDYGDDYKDGELEAGEPLAAWEIALLDASRPSYKSAAAKAAHPSNGKVENDPVNNPAHYTQYPVEVIELTRHMSFDRGNAVKYIARAGFKDKATEKQDIEKAIWYLQDDLKELERKEAAK